MSFDINCELLLAEFDFERDARRPPDNRRKGRFRAGWEDAVVRARTYDGRILKRLTWHNLGYRLGKRFGEKSVDEIDEIYERFSQHYNIMVSNGAERNIFPEEVDENSDFLEGTVRRITVNAYERNPQARSKCIARYGAQCFICGFDFERKYGDVGKGFIHVHHLRQLSEIGEQYKVDPVADMRPVCPNCHAIIHRCTPPYSIEEIQAMIKRVEG